jgi:hypothetical protein
MQLRTQATVRTRRRPSRRWCSTSIRYREPRVPIPQLRTSMPWPEEKGMEIRKTPARPTTERRTNWNRTSVEETRHRSQRLFISFKMPGRQPTDPLHRGMAAVQFIFRQVHFHRLQPSITYRASPTCMEISIRAVRPYKMRPSPRRTFLKTC